MIPSTPHDYTESRFMDDGLHNLNCGTCKGQPLTLHQGTQIWDKVLLSLAQATWSPRHPTSCCLHVGDKVWVWQPPCRQPGQRLEGVLTSPLPLSLPRPLPPRACSVLPAGSPCSHTMGDGIKVTFLAVTVADNLSHEFNMLWMGYSRKVLIIWHGLIPAHHLVLMDGF